MVLKTRPDRPVTVPVWSGQLGQKEVEPESDRRIGQTVRLPPNRTVQLILFFLNIKTMPF